GCSTDGTSHLHCYSYLRGLDGTVPHPHAEAKTDKSQAPSGIQSADELAAVREALERPEGNGQLDYLRRLADSLDVLEAQLGSDCGAWARFRNRCRRIVAIGVLGSDVYDKLLVLQALRPRFPDVIFFTTDLDAVLVHPTQVQWTRNVVIASAFGLRLAESLQQAIPPFRDSYQTATFMATLGALGRLPASGQGVISADGESTIFDSSIAPPVRLFEVGREGAFDLSVAADERNVHPPTDVGSLSARELAAGRWLWGLLAFCALLLSLPLVARRDKSRKEVNAGGLLMLV